MKKDDMPLGVVSAFCPGAPESNRKSICPDFINLNDGWGFYNSRGVAQYGWQVGSSPP
jgi:hypothetical protein